jgi:Tol biopolymer transport system component/tRNA A-37 threonylcarbamoyl transferase component Bud32
MEQLIGQSLGHYRITAALGAGGMGEVYRATDTTLNRDVAIKILPVEMAQDSQRLARFRREAQLLAALNHPNIAAIYGLEEAKGKPFLALELVEGEDLKERLERGAVPVDEALEIAEQIAEALEEAHNKGIVHRDLKPANVKITPDGKAKVLDFGIAKAWAGDDAGETAEALSESLTLTHTGTVAGAILGTAAYMSPEQARGKPVDKRADVWSFGVVLWEMLTGQALFSGDTVADIIEAVVTKEPDLDAVPASTPRAVRRLLARCLRKDPRTRLPDIGAARLELQDVLAGSTVEPGAAGTDEDASGATEVRRLVLQRWAWAAALLVTAGLAGFLTVVLLTQTPEARPAAHFIFDPPGDVTLSDFNPLAVSPDGGSIVFAGWPPVGAVRLWIRTLDAPEVRALPGTEGAGQPFWSPDGSSIAFFAEGELRKLNLASGNVQRICALPPGSSGPAGTWSNEGTIAFSTGAVSGLYSVSAAGGEPRPLTTPDEQTHHWWPQFLPDGRSFLFEIYGLQAEKKGVHVASLDVPDEWRRLLPVPMRVRYGSGHLLFVQDGSTLLAQPFDVARAELSGDPVAVASSVASGAVPRWGWFSVSATGVLTYLEGITNIQLVWLDRAGKRLGTLGDPGRYHGPIVLSPDDSRVAVQIMAGDGQSDIWVVDVARGLASRVTTGPPQATDPVWSPDGRELMFEGGPGGGDLYRKELRAGATASSLLETTEYKIPEDWSRDGKTILYRTAGEESALWALPLDGDGSPELVLKTESSLRQPQMSPDGRWLAYMSDESGRYEVYVEPFRRPGQRVRVSPDGGRQPKWRGDGKELFYLSPDGQLMAVDVREGASGPDVGMPAVLVPADKAVARVWGRDDYAVTADGQRFLVKTRVEEEDRRIHVLLNWTSLLE